jgi:hypothetical protein
MESLFEVSVISVNGVAASGTRTLYSDRVIWAKAFGGNTKIIYDREKTEYIVSGDISTIAAGFGLISLSQTSYNTTPTNITTYINPELIIDIKADQAGSKIIYGSIADRWHKQVSVSESAAQVISLISGASSGGNSYFPSGYVEAGYWV